MGKVVKLKLVKPRKKNKASEFDKELLNYVLDGLESGRIEEIAVVGINKDGTMTLGWSAPRQTSSAFRMIGSMEKLKSKYMHNYIED